MRTAPILNDILKELERAEKLHPDWPTDTIHQMSIVSEECGEATQAANNHVYHDQPIHNVRKELIHTGAMVVRMLKNLNHE